MKKGLDRHLNPLNQIEYNKKYRILKHQSFIFFLDKIKDKQIIEYFVKSDNKTETLRKLYQGFDKKGGYLQYFYLDLL